MEVNTVGTAIRFGMDLEEQAAAFYEGAAASGKLGPASETFAALAGDCRKQISALQSLYQENVFSDMDVGVLEPIAGLEPDDYALVADAAQVSGAVDAVRTALELEGTVARFYGAAVGQIKRRTVARRLEKLTRENTQRLEKLQQL